MAALSAAVVVLTLAGCNRSVTDAERQDDRTGGSLAGHPLAPPGRHAETRPTPGERRALDAADAYDAARGHGMAGGPANGYRFRTLDADRSAANRPQPPGYPSQTGLEAPYGERVDTVPGAGYRFRPPDEARATRRYQPYSPPAHAWNAAPPGAYPEQQDRRGQIPADIPAGAPYRFRPLDEAQQSRRWSGNYWPMSLNPAQVAGPHNAARIAPDPT